MPLSKPSPRKHLHTRDIRCTGFQRDDGLWDIEGSMTDKKSYSFDNVDRGGVAAGEAIHHMLIRLTVDDDLVVQAAQASTEAGPYSICGDITANFANLNGVRIGPGWRKEITRLMGGVAGCTHLRDLLMGPLAVTALQTVVPVRAKRDGGKGDTKPGLINTCHAYADDGPIVARQWPAHSRKSEEA